MNVTSNLQNVSRRMQNESALSQCHRTLQCRKVYLRVGPVLTQTYSNLELIALTTDRRMIRRGGSFVRKEQERRAIDLLL